MPKNQGEIGAKRLLQLSGEIIKIKIMELQEVPERISTAPCAYKIYQVFVYTPDRFVELKIVF